MREYIKGVFSVICLLLGAGPAMAASTWDGIYSDEQAARGATRYQAVCAMCHGTDLQGNGEAPPLVGRFMPDWEGTTLADLSEKIRETMPLFAPGSLSPGDTGDIIAFILKSNGFPAGSSLPSGAVLKSIRFDVYPATKAKRDR